MLERFKKWLNADQPKQASEVSALVSTELANLDYHPKIIVAWSKALLGEHQFSDYLLKNGFEELYHATQAIYLKDEARTWLMNNGYAHLMAMINGVEGNGQALTWLKMYNYDLLYNLALAGDGEKDGYLWLNTYSTPDIFMLAKTIQSVKDGIEANHNDVHSFRKD
jgi:hypothetical protein